MPQRSNKLNNIFTKKKTIGGGGMEDGERMESSGIIPYIRVLWILHEMKYKKANGERRGGREFISG